MSHDLELGGWCKWVGVGGRDDNPVHLGRVLVVFSPQLSLFFSEEGGGRIKMAVVDADWSPPPPSIAHPCGEAAEGGPPPSSEIWKNLEPLGEDFFFLEYEYEQVDKTKMFCVNFVHWFGTSV